MPVFLHRSTCLILFSLITRLSLSEKVAFPIFYLLFISFVNIIISNLKNINKTKTIIPYNLRRKIMVANDGENCRRGYCF